MQLFVRTLQGRTCVIEARPEDTVKAVKQRIEAREGLPAEHQVLLRSSRILEDARELGSCGVGAQAGLVLTSRLRGGKPVKVKMMTNHLPCGPEVTIDLEPNATKDEIKAKLAPLTGVPPEHQKVMLSGINQIVMGDKRTNLMYSACGTSDGVQLAVGTKV